HLASYLAESYWHSPSRWDWGLRIWSAGPGRNRTGVRKRGTMNYSTSDLSDRLSFENTQEAAKWNMDPFRTIGVLELQLIKRSLQKKHFQQVREIVPSRQKPGLTDRLDITFKEKIRSLALPQSGEAGQILRLLLFVVGVSHKSGRSCIT